MKKDTFYKEDFLKALLKINGDLSINMLGDLATYSNLKSFGGARNYQRKYCLNLLHYLLVIPNIDQNKLKTEVKL